MTVLLCNRLPEDLSMIVTMNLSLPEERMSCLEAHRSYNLTALNSTLIHTIKKHHENITIKYHYSPLKAGNRQVFPSQCHVVFTPSVRESNSLCRPPNHRMVERGAWYQRGPFLCLSTEWDDSVNRTSFSPFVVVSCRFLNCPLLSGGDHLCLHFGNLSVRHRIRSERDKHSVDDNSAVESARQVACLTQQLIFRCRARREELPNHSYCP